MNSETFNLSYTYTDPDTSESITVSGATISYPSKDVGAVTATATQLKGDGYYGRSDGFHTVQINLTGFIGTVSIQGTLETNPSNDDWFSVELESSGTSTIGYVDTTGAITTTSPTVSSITFTENETSVNNYNFTGNYVWLRAYISNWTDGTVNSIQLNH